MNTLNLKLQESVNDITLPKIEEIVLEFIGVGSKVFQIGKQGPIPFEVISGSVTFYKANSVSDLTTEGKTAYSNSFPNTDSHHLAVVSSSCKIRLLPSLASGIWVTNVSQNGMSVSGSICNVGDCAARLGTVNFVSNVPIFPVTFSRARNLTV